MKVKFTTEKPKSSGLYLIPEGELIDIRYSKEDKLWWVSDYPRYKACFPWTSDIERSTTKFELDKSETIII